MLEKLRTKNGESSVLIILLFTAAIIFMILPVVTIVFDSALVRIAAQEVFDQIDLQSYVVFQSLEIDALSKMNLALDKNVVERLNKDLCFKHPMIESVIVKNVVINYQEMHQLIISVEIIMNPTLYRSVYQLNEKHFFIHSMQVPIDGEIHEESSL